MIPRWMVLVSAVLGSCAWDCGGSHVTPVDESQMVTEAYEDTNCVIDNRGDAGAIDKCRASVKRAWDAYWSARFSDGGGSTP